MEDFLTLEMPAFKPKYKKWKRYGYADAVEKCNLKTVLEASTDGYCMYCYSRIRVDQKLFANLEHAIEKANSDKLIECIPNPDKPEKILQFLHISSTIKKNVGGCVHVTYR